MVFPSSTVSVNLFVYYDDDRVQLLVSEEYETA